MFRTLIYPSSGDCDCVVELPYRSSCSQFVVCWRFDAAGFWVVFVLQVEAQAVLQPAKRTPLKTQPHQISNTQRTENKTTDMVIQQHSRKLVMMDILMSETCWAHNKWNKIASDTKLVFHSFLCTSVNIYLVLISVIGHVFGSWLYSVINTKYGYNTAGPQCFALLNLCRSTSATPRCDTSRRLN